MSFIMDHHHHHHETVWSLRSITEETQLVALHRTTQDPAPGAGNHHQMARFGKGKSRKAQFKNSKTDRRPGNPAERKRSGEAHSATYAKKMKELNQLNQEEASNIPRPWINTLQQMWSQKNWQKPKAQQDPQHIVPTLTTRQRPNGYNQKQE